MRSRPLITLRVPRVVTLRVPRVLYAGDTFDVGISVDGLGGGVAVAPGEIAVVMAGPLADPAAAREVLRPMLALARKMRGERRVGPYR